MKSVIILVVLVGAVLSTETVRERRDSVDLELEPHSPMPDPAKVSQTLKKAKYMMLKAIEKVEDPSGVVNSDEDEGKIEIPVGDIDETKRSVKQKRSGLLRVRVFGKK